MSRFYYLSSRFVGERSRLITKKAPLDNITVEADEDIYKSALFELFEIMQYERCGILFGEYICTEHGHLLINRHGQFIKINLDGEGDGDLFPGTFVHNQITDDLPKTYMKTMIKNWDHFPLYENIPIITTFWNINYYHFSLELLPKIDMLGQFNPQMFAIPSFCLAKPVQRDLMQRVLGERKLLSYDKPFRVKDPLLAHTYMSYEGAMWLRSVMKMAPKPGLKRYYLRRLRSSRNGAFGGVSEDADFLAFLARYDFEVVDFGNGDKGLAEQLNMLAGAQVILSPHGASLTNIVYLNKPVTIIEIFSSQYLAAMYADLSAILGFDYFGFISSRLDAGGNIVVDAGRLSAIMDNI